jgi:hypothetical protein
MMKRNRIARVLRIILMVIAGLALFSFLVMRLWNWLAPDIFGGHHITFWQALGLLALSKILFGGFRGGWGRRGGHWPGRMRERWERMTPEEREKFRKGMRECGFSRAPADDEIAPGATTQAAQR